MLRLVLSIAACGAALVPTLTFDALRQTLDPARGNRIDPGKLAVLETGCYLLAGALMLAALFLPRLLSLLGAAVVRLESSGLSTGLRRPAGTAWLPRVLEAAFVLVAIALPGFLLLERQAGLPLMLEDGPVETTTAALYLLSALWTVVTATRLRDAPGARLSLCALAGLFFFVGMEEISWGQRFLGLDTPAALRELNVQGEITLHNLWSTSINQAVALLVTFTLLVILPVLYEASSWARRALDAVGAPVAPLELTALYAIAIVATVVVGLDLGTLGIGPRSLHGFKAHFDDECLEFFIACLFFIASLAAWRTEAPARTPGDTASVAG